MLFAHGLQGNLAVVEYLPMQWKKHIAKCYDNDNMIVDVTNGCAINRDCSRS